MSPAKQQLLRDEAAGWLKVAKHLHAAKRIGSGLCGELPRVGGIDKPTREAMYDRLMPHLFGFIYLENHANEQRTGTPDNIACQSRETFCCLLSAECDDESRSVAPKKRRSSSHRRASK